LPRDARNDAVSAYESALERLTYAVKTWEEAGSPLTSMGSQGQEVIHPLWKVVNEAEMVADKLRSRVDKQHRGPQPIARLQPRIGESPAARLRKVG
jgi:hypothetical protein